MSIDWKPLFQEYFNAKTTLRGRDIERFFVPRGESGAVRVRQRLDESDDELQRFLLTGSIGSGKSTELAQLAEMLSSEYAVIGVDVRESAANVNEVNGTEVLFLVGAAAIRLAKEHWGREISQPVREEFMTAFLGTTQGHGRLDVAGLIENVAVFGATVADLATSGGIGSAGVTATRAAARSALALRRSRPLGGLTRRDLRVGDPEIDRLARALDALLNEVGRVKPPFVLVDGLDRVNDASAMKRLFVDSQMLDLVGCSTVYVAPALLWLSDDLSQVLTGDRFIPCHTPNVPVEHPQQGARATLEDDVLREARALLREVLRRRTVAAGYQLADLFEPDALEQVITWSGGVIRRLVHLASHACRLQHRASATTPIDGDVARQAFQDLAEDLQLVATNSETLTELQHVEQTGEISGNDASFRLVLNGAVLDYRNTYPWYRANPSLRPLVQGRG